MISPSSGALPFFNNSLPESLNKSFSWLSFQAQEINFETGNPCSANFIPGARESDNDIVPNLINIFSQP